MINWGLPIWLYLWMAGMAGGAYFTAFLYERFAREPNKRLLRLATYLGIPLAGIGVTILLLDLGSPFRFWHLIVRVKLISPMSMGTWILVAWMSIAIAMVVFWWVEPRLKKDKVVSILKPAILALGWVELMLSALLISYTGVLLSVSSQPLWAATFLLPPLFVVSAISTGSAILMITALVANAIHSRGTLKLKRAMNQLFGTTDWTVSNRVVGRLAEADAIVILIELLVLIGYAFWLSASTTAGAGEAIKLLTAGALAVPFWIGIVLIALLFPLGLEAVNWGKEITTKAVWQIVIASATCVVLGGLIVRAVVVMGAQL